ncbi:hypothetical protein BH18ACT2_BH18ACT2_18750 [soil metagenome]
MRRAVAPEVDAGPCSVTLAGGDSHRFRAENGCVHFTVALIGPVAVGKSTVGSLLATRVGRPFIDLDEIAERYYDAAAMPVGELVDRAALVGMHAAHRWWQPARVLAVEQALVHHRGAVIALGAGHSHFEDDEYAQRVAAALADALVVLLLPHDDPCVGRTILAQRCRDDDRPNWDAAGLLVEWLESSQNRRLADVLVVVGSDTPTRVVQRIVSLLPAAAEH